MAKVPNTISDKKHKDLERRAQAAQRKRREEWLSKKATDRARAQAANRKKSGWS